METTESATPVDRLVMPVLYEVQSRWPEAALSWEREWHAHPGLCRSLQEAEEYQQKRKAIAKWYMATFRIVEVEA